MLTAYGAVAVTFMMAMYALERRHRRYVLGFALGCLLSSSYGFLSGTWPFGVVEAVWSLIALRRYITARSGVPSAERSSAGDCGGDPGDDVGGSDPRPGPDDPAPDDADEDRAVYGVASSGGAGAGHGTDERLVHGGEEPEGDGGDHHHGLDGLGGHGHGPVEFHDVERDSPQERTTPGQHAEGEASAADDTGDER